MPKASTNYAISIADAKAGRILTRRKKPRKASRLVADESRAERHIKPLHGRRAV
jgi:hypothetical protein